MRKLACLSILAASAAAQASLIWSNFNSPDDLMTTGDAWTASRANDPDFVSYRCAADDFILTERTRLTSITYYASPIGDPEILGGDWYIYSGENGSGPPGQVITGAFSQTLVRNNTGWSNPNFGEIWTNRLAMDVTLDPGHYFIGFRTFQTFSNGGGKNGILTTRIQKGTARAHWSFDILEDGNQFGPWVTMDVFNQYPDNEWVFDLEGDIVPEPASLAVLGALILGLRRKR